MLQFMKKEVTVVEFFVSFVPVASVCVFFFFTVYSKILVTASSNTGRKPIKARQKGSQPDSKSALPVKTEWRILGWSSA